MIGYMLALPMIPRSLKFVQVFQAYVDFLYAATVEIERLQDHSVRTETKFLLTALVLLLLSPTSAKRMVLL